MKYPKLAVYVPAPLAATMAVEAALCATALFVLLFVPSIV